jgi:hypothetical protein
VDEKQAQLEWEARAGRLAGAAAWLAAALILAAFAYSIAALPHTAGNLAKTLPQLEAHKNAFLVSAILTGLGMLAFIPPLYYLYRATLFRRREIPSITRILLVAGPVLLAICMVWLQLREAHVADQFTAGSLKTNKHAEDLLRNATTLAAGLRLAASIATGLATVLIALNAMRAGLLSRFMGVMGIILGALFVVPVIASPIIQLFWLIALGALFINRWPGGRGPAWETGEAVPWPRAQQRAGAPEEEEEAGATELEPGTEHSAPRQPNPRASRKRKKKSRR